MYAGGGAWLEISREEGVGSVEEERMGTFEKVPEPRDTVVVESDERVGSRRKISCRAKRAFA
jgi:hypothetical protein